MRENNKQSGATFDFQKKKKTFELNRAQCAHMSGPKATKINVKFTRKSLDGQNRSVAMDQHKQITYFTEIWRFGNCCYTIRTATKPRRKLNCN